MLRVPNAAIKDVKGNEQGGSAHPPRSHLPTEGLEPRQADINLPLTACKKWAYNCIIGGK